MLHEAVACLAVDEESLERAEKAFRASRHVRQANEAMRQRLSGLAATQLLVADRVPEVIDHPGRITVDLTRREFKMLGPKP